jgi:hypothetical protein
MDELIGKNGALTLLLHDGREANGKGDGLILVSSWEVHLMAIKCFESLVFIPDTRDCTGGGLQLPYLEICAQVFLKQLYVEKHPEQEELLYCKVCCMSVKFLYVYEMWSLTQKK